MSKKIMSQKDKSKYMTLLVNGKRRLSVVTVTISGAVLFGFLFDTKAFSGPNAYWWLFALGFCATVMVLMPLSEEWHYVPWQDAPQKCEKDSFD
jgi:F0F1-type ATP synthase assembly protein I